MKNILYLGAFAFLALSATTSCQDNKKGKNYNDKSTVDDKAMEFLKRANQAGLTEIKAAGLAQRNSKNVRVISFAKMMIADHSTTGNELNKLADDKYVSTTDTIIDSNHLQMINDMGKLTGPAFDKVYMQMMVTDHAKVIDMYRDVTRNKTKAVQKFAEKTLPVLIMHLDSAKAINATIK